MTEEILETIILPPIYAQRCQELCDKALGRTYYPNRFRSLSDSYSLLIEHGSLTPAQATTFIHEVLVNLNCPHSLSALQKKVDASFSLEVSYPTVWASLMDMKCHIHIREISTLLNRQLFKFYVELFRLIVLSFLSLRDETVNITQRNSDSFYQLFELLSETLHCPKLATAITCTVLRRFGLQNDHLIQLEQYIPDGFNLPQNYPAIHLRIKMVEFFFSLKCHDSRLAMMVLSHDHLGGEAIDHYTPLMFIHKLFDMGVISVDDFSVLNKIATSFNNPHFFTLSGKCLCIIC